MSINTYVSPQSALHHLPPKCFNDMRHLFPWLMCKCTKSCSIQCIVKTKRFDRQSDPPALVPSDPPVHVPGDHPPPYVYDPALDTAAQPAMPVYGTFPWEDTSRNRRREEATHCGPQDFIILALILIVGCFIWINMFTCDAWDPSCGSGWT